MAYDCYNIRKIDCIFYFEYYILQVRPNKTKDISKLFFLLKSYYVNYYPKFKIFNTSYIIVIIQGEKKPIPKLKTI